MKWTVKAVSSNGTNYEQVFEADDKDEAIRLFIGNWNNDHRGYIDYSSIEVKEVVPDVPILFDNAAVLSALHGIGEWIKLAEQKLKIIEAQQERLIKMVDSLNDTLVEYIEGEEELEDITESNMFQDFTKPDPNA